MQKYRYADVSRIKSNFTIIAVIALVSGFLLGSFSVQPEIKVYPASYVSESMILLPAVDDEGNGLVTPLKVEVRAGNGRILTNIDKLLFWVDTQFSIRTAKSVAEDYTRINTSKFDLIYTIESSEATVIGGPSAGAALTVATIAALQNKSLNPNVMITGTIELDGSIGKVGG